MVEMTHTIKKIRAAVVTAQKQNVLMWKPSKWPAEWSQSLHFQQVQELFCVKVICFQQIQLQHWSNRVMFELVWLMQLMDLKTSCNTNITYKIIQGLHMNCT